MEVIAQNGQVLLILAVVFGFYMTWGIGANDVANAMGTSVGSGAITFKRAIQDDTAYIAEVSPVLGEAARKIRQLSRYS